MPDMVVSFLQFYVLFEKNLKSIIDLRNNLMGPEILLALALPFVVYGAIELMGS